MSTGTPIYICQKIPQGTIIIDGILSDPGWQAIKPVGEFILFDGSGPAARQTEARMCWDDDNLYISFKCEDPDIWGTFFNRDDPIYEEEVVEAFIDPDSDLKRYYELQTSPRRVLFDAIIYNPTGLRKDMAADTSWTCGGWQVGVNVDGTLENRNDIDRGWTVEWAIPFASLPTAPNIPPKNGDTWRLNLYRIDRTPTPEFSCWSPTLETPPNFHVPSRFGTIVFRE
ncbi:MAG: carbohydrate-binding family 9-like protein [Armatimonadetes bacterium]|nr:carbohydrate-binding family 9-like protein [Armatimonadota bacterium]